MVRNKNHAETIKLSCALITSFGDNKLACMEETKMKKIKRISICAALAIFCLPAFADNRTPETNALVSAEWHSLVDPLGPIAEKVAGYLSDPNDPQLRREMYRALFSGISLGYLGLTNSDPKHPDFFPYTTQAYNAFSNNPDDDYYVVPIEDGAVYKITGFRGTVKKVDFQIGAGMLIPRGIVDEYYLGKNLGNYDLNDDVHLRKDGSFEVILSAERPAGYKGDWWLMKPGVSNILVRQISYDWVHEVDARLAIERLDTPAVKPRPSAEQLEANLRQIAGWTETTVKASAQFIKSIRSEMGINKIAYKNMAAYAGHLTQRYAYGGFDLKPDEALVVEAKVPKQCRYWSIHLVDDFGYMIDWMNRQTNINGFNAKIDKDGVFRAVISAQDPGVPNWLDTAGYKTGAIQVRWEKCNEWPDHKASLIKVADVRNVLPRETPTVTAEARDASIRMRRRGAQMRKRW